MTLRSAISIMIATAALAWCAGSALAQTEDQPATAATQSTQTTPTAMPPPSPLAEIGAPPPAPPAPTGPVMTLDQVIAQVLNLNPTIVQARLSEQRAHALVGEAGASGLPQIRIGAADTYSSIATTGVSSVVAPTVSPVVSTPIITDSASGSLSPGVSQPLSSGASSVSSGSGSSTSPTITPTINPVGAPVGSSGGSSSSSSSAGSSSSSTSSSNSTSPSLAQSTPAAQAASNTQQTITLRHNNYDATGSITQLVDVFGLVHDNVAAAKENDRFYQLDLNRVEDDEALNVKDVYFAVIKAQSDVASGQEQLTNANATLQNAQINYKAGASPDFDVISAQAQVASAQATLINAQNELDIDKANLNNLLTQPIDAPVNVAPVPEITVPADTSTDQAIAQADENRPEVQETLITQKIAGNLTRLAREGLLPSVGVGGAAAYQPYLTPTTTGSSPSHYTESITAAVSVPLWDGGATASAVEAARINEADQRSIRNQILDDVSLEVKSALVNVIDAQSLSTADQAAVTADREALRIAGISYRAGAGTLLEVTNAEANLATAEDNLNSAVYQQQTAYAALLRAEGTR